MSVEEVGAPSPDQKRSIGWLVRSVGVLVFAGLATLLFVVVVLPDGNDFARATVLKHARLASQASPKIVFVGGSNLAFGLESDIIEQTLDRPAVNMGMNGYLGIRFMFAEVAPSLKPGDIVVLAFEYDTFFKSPDGTPSDHLMLVKVKPSHLGSLTWRQRMRLVGVLPYVAQQKTHRIIREAIDIGGTSLRRLSGREPDRVDTPATRAMTTILAVESASGFDEQGDLNSHIGVTWGHVLEDGLDASATPLDSEVFGVLADFVSEMRGRGVRVMLSYTPVIERYFSQHRPALGTLHRRLKAVPGLAVPSSPDAFVFAEPFFFDTIYHLNEEGRRSRSKRVAHDLASFTGTPSPMPTHED